jgi:hypothetical protein
MATDIIAISVSLTALGISVVTFYIGHTRAKKSEEIHISREIWDRIDLQQRIVEKWTEEDHSSSHDCSPPPIDAMDLSLAIFCSMAYNDVLPTS